ncbi:Tyrosine recombinase XerC [bioreactor metagenome]|uniref:Tyrosine recombinase XerC n=1 Tax=bioreactor metagenome TaxID=1076179 RepID=A0A644XCI4_9ZZZZ
MSTVPILKEYSSLKPGDVIPLFLTFKSVSGVSPRTQRDYEYTLRLFFGRFPDALDHPRERTFEFLARYQNPSSFNVFFSYLKNFWDWTMREGYFRGDRHPLDGLKKRKPRGRIVQLEEGEIRSLLEQPDKSTYAGFRDYALLCLQIDTAARPGELLQLLPEDFHPRKAEIAIRAEVSKTRTPRVLPLASPTVEAMGKLLSSRPEAWANFPVFASETAGALQETSWSRRVKRYGEKCGLRITAYSLRHAAALLLIRRGADAFCVQRLLGHASMQMTRHYINLTAEDTRKGHEKAGVILSILGRDCLKGGREGEGIGGGLPLAEGG